MMYAQTLTGNNFVNCMKLNRKLSKKTKKIKTGEKDKFHKGV